MQTMTYPVSTRALDKWARADLTCAAERDGALHYRYHYTGSTCNDGGSYFQATFHAVVRPHPGGVVVTNAWIDLPLEDNPGATQMCAYWTQREPFLRELAQPPAFCGRTIEDIVNQPMALDYAGCLCYEPMLNHKWRNVLSTIHYALAQRIVAGPHTQV